MTVSLPSWHCKTAGFRWNFYLSSFFFILCELPFSGGSWEPKCVSVKFVGSGSLGGRYQSDSHQVAPFHWKIDKPGKMQWIVQYGMRLP